MQFLAIRLEFLLQDAIGLLAASLAVESTCASKCVAVRAADLFRCRRKEANADGGIAVDTRLRPSRLARLT